MNLSINTTFLVLDDPDEAITFYRDVLGLELVNEVGKDRMRWLTFVAPGKPDVNLVLTPPNPDASPDDQKVIGDLAAKGVLGSIIFATDDVDATFDKIVAAGADVVQEPTDQFWGVRDCAFRDPAGNHIRINQPAKG